MAKKKSTKKKLNNTMDMSARINKFNTVVQSVYNHINNNTVNDVFMEFKCGNLTITTDSQNHNMVAVDGKKVSMNIFTSLEVKKNGSGKANAFTLNIAYSPNIKTISKDMNNINFIDQTLCRSRNCTLKYGYYGSDGLVTKYKGYIIDYDIEVENRVIRYTITGYSSVSAVSDLKFTFYPVVGGGRGSDPPETKKPNHVYFDKLKSDGTYVNVARYVLEEAFGPKTSYGYKVFLAKGLKCAKMGPSTMIDAVSDVSIFDYVKDILSRQRHPDDVSEEEDYSDSKKSKKNKKNKKNNKKKSSKNDTSNKDIDDNVPKYTYNYSISDRDDRYILIYAEPNDSKVTAGFEFDIGNRTSIVKSFKANFKGALIAAIYNTLNTPNSSVTIDSNGNIVGSNKYGTAIGSNADSKKESALWRHAIDQAYTASLIVEGIPYEPPLTTKINIKNMVYTQKHITSGVYSITGIVDNIDSSGFQTTYELIRLNSDQVNEYYKSIGKKSNETLKSLMGDINESNSSTKANIDSPVDANGDGVIDINDVTAMQQDIRDNGDTNYNAGDVAFMQDYIANNGSNNQNNSNNNQNNQESPTEPALDPVPENY